MATPRWRSPALFLLVLLLAVLAAATWFRRDLGQSMRGTPGAKASLAIEQFTTTGGEFVEWNAAAFADALAARLQDVEGLSASVAREPGGSEEFALSGDVRVSEGRVVLTTRLIYAGERQPVWSGTFWRSQDAMDNFVDDVAAGVAQALYADIARRALATSKERS